MIIARCPYCDSIWVCWNWFHAWGGDRERHEKENSHIPPDQLDNWGHECWDCENTNTTKNKVRNGVPYWFLRIFYKC